MTTNYQKINDQNIWIAKILIEVTKVMAACRLRDLGAISSDSVIVNWSLDF